MQHVSIPVVNMPRTGGNIRRLRKQSGMSVKNLQEVFGFATPQAIYKWQQGSSLPSIDNLLVLSNLFGVPMEEIIAVDVLP